MRTGSTSGSSSVEFALVSGAVMTILLGILCIGLLTWTKNGLQIAANLTARCVAIGSCGDPSGFAHTIASNWLGGTAAGIVVTVASSSPCTGVNGSYSGFEKVTIQSTQWTKFPPPFSIMLQASACYPVHS